VRKRVVERAGPHVEPPVKRVGRELAAGVEELGGGPAVVGTGGSGGGRFRACGDGRGRRDFAEVRGPSRIGVGSATDCVTRRLHERVVVAAEVGV
jgi:hypothetical protein